MEDKNILFFLFWEYIFFLFFFYLTLNQAIHDGSEAYICDIIRPFKPEIPEYKIFEKNVEIAIYEKFGLTYPTEDVHKIIKRSLPT